MIIKEANGRLPTGFPEDPSGRTTLVVKAALCGVPKHTVGFIQLLKPAIGSLFLALLHMIRMPFHGLPAVRCLYSPTTFPSDSTSHSLRGIGTKQ